MSRDDLKTAATIDFNRARDELADAYYRQQFADGSQSTLDTALEQYHVARGILLARQAA